MCSLMAWRTRYALVTEALERKEQDLILTWTVIGCMEAFSISRVRTSRIEQPKHLCFHLGARNSSYFTQSTA
jgi:hypothetical protein